MNGSIVATSNLGYWSERSTLDSAVESAEELCRTYGGAVVFTAKADLTTGGYSSCEVLRKFGEVPKDPML
jgi:hypothetical protein